MRPSRSLRTTAPVAALTHAIPAHGNAPQPGRHTTPPRPRPAHAPAGTGITGTGPVAPVACPIKWPEALGD